MRSALSLAIIVSIGTAGTSSAALIEVTTGITASANGWDTRIEGHGCVPSGCVADNVLDASIEDASRWSCKREVSALNEACALTLVFDEPQDIMEMRLALYKGDERTRSVNVIVDGTLVSTIESSGITTGLEAFELNELQATTIVLQSTGTEENGWISFTGVQFMVESEVPVSPDSPAPSDDDYIGCYSDVVGDRVLTSVETSEDLTPTTCAITCAIMGNSYYALQQGSECWCAGCDLTDNETNTDYDRHGAGICSTPCAGDSTSTCGGDLAFSLYQTFTCAATLEPSVPPILPSPSTTPRTAPVLTASTSSTTSSSSPTVSGTVLENLGDLPDALAASIMADAVGGFAGPGYLEITDEENENYVLGNGNPFIIGKDEAGTLTVSGTFRRYDEAALPSSTALFVYLDNDDEALSDFVGSQADLDASTGAFTITAADFPSAFTRVILSFAVLNPAEALENANAFSVLAMPVVNNGCSDPLTFTLEWDNDSDLDLWVYEPGGKLVFFGKRAGDVGYLDDDSSDGSESETYVVYGGLGDAVLGEYQAVAVGFYVDVEVAWTLTARSDGEVLWIEQGVFTDTTSSSSSTDDNSITAIPIPVDTSTTDDASDTDDNTTPTLRHLFSFSTDDSTPLSESYYSDESASMKQRSDTFTVMLDSYTEVVC